VASVFASLPTWKWFDPISILGSSRRPKTRPSGNAAKETSKLKELLE
jgi:hypothetical protein